MFKFATLIYTKPLFSFLIKFSEGEENQMKQKDKLHNLNDQLHIHELSLREVHCIMPQINNGRALMEIKITKFLLDSAEVDGDLNLANNS